MKFTDFTEVSLVVFLELLLTCENILSFRMNTRGDNCVISIPEDYDGYKAPFHNGKPANVFLQIEVLDLDEIMEATMDFRLHGFVRTVWHDYRVNLSSSNVNEDCAKTLWIPDMTFEEAKAFADTGTYNTYLTTYFTETRGYFYLSQRYSFKVSCMMNFQNYPFDTQICMFSIAFMYSDSTEAVLKWINDDESPFREFEPILLTKEIDPLQFILQQPKTNSEEKKFLFANFTYLSVDFTLTRRLTGSIINYYMPSALLVFISWITFWLGEDAAPERVTLTMTALLTICTQGDHYKSELPPVNYITAMDIWFFVCIFMIFASLAEFAFSYSTYKYEKMKNREIKDISNMEKVSDHPELMKKFTSKLPAEFINRNSGDDTIQEELVNAFPYSERKINLDSVCKIVFPGTFLIFNIIYWVQYSDNLKL